MPAATCRPQNISSVESTTPPHRRCRFPSSPALWRCTPTHRDVAAVKTFSACCFLWLSGTLGCFHSPRPPGSTEGSPSCSCQKSFRVSWSRRYRQRGRRADAHPRFCLEGNLGIRCIKAKKERGEVASATVACRLLRFRGFFPPFVVTSLTSGVAGF